jgi:uncharacterized protein
MIIRIDDIPEEGLDLDLSREKHILTDLPSPIPLPPGVAIDPGVEGHLRVFVDKEDIFLIGRVRAVLHLQCSRCLENFSLEKDVDLNVILRRGSVDSALKDPESDAAQGETVFIESDEIYVGEILLQEILLELPMKPLCREECPGLCPRCGARAGSPECTCLREERSDPRWNALAELKKKLSK